MKGTSTKRLKANGRFSFGYIFWGPDQNGKRHQIAKGGFKTKGEADDACAIAIANCKATATEEKELSAEELLEAIRGFKEKRDAPPPPPPPPEPEPIPAPTFEEFFARWIREHAARRCSPKTLEGYQQHGAYAIREFGSVPINELTAERLEMAMNHLQDCGGKKGRPLSPKTIRHISFAVSGSLKKARKWHLVERNMMEDVDRAKEAVKPEPKVLDNSGIKRLLDRAETTRLYPLLVLAASTGMRRGELLALQWQDLNFATGVLQVTKSLEETKSGLRVKSTKSGRPRSFSVPAAAITTLEHHREEQDSDRAIYGASYEEHDLIFCRPDGAYYRPDQMSARVTALARKSGLPGIGLHSLRHSHASQLLSSGTPITVIADRLGHANSAVTLSIYSHALPADVNAAAENWNTAMANTIQTERKNRPARMLVNVSGKHPPKSQVTERKTG